MPLGIANGAADLIQGVLEEGGPHGTALGNDIHVNILRIIGMVDHLGGELHPSG